MLAWNIFIILISLFSVSCTLDAQIIQGFSSIETPTNSLLKGICSDGEIEKVSPLSDSRYLLTGDFSNLGVCLGRNTSLGPNKLSFKFNDEPIAKTIKASDGGYYVLIHSYNSKEIIRKFDSQGNLDRSISFKLPDDRMLEVRDLFDIVETSDKVIVGGDFRELSHPYGGILDSETGSPKISNLKQMQFLDSSAVTMVADGHGGWYVAGSFYRINNVNVSNIIRIDSQGDLISSFQPEVYGEIRSLVLDASSNKLYIQGNLEKVGPLKNINIAAVDALTGWATSLSIKANALWGSSSALAVDPSRNIVYFGGDIEYEGASYAGVLKFDAFSGAHLGSPLLISGGGWPGIKDLKVIKDTLYVAGSFTSVNGQARHSIAAIDLTTGNLNSWNPNTSGSDINIITTDENESYVYLAGDRIIVNSTIYKAAVRFKTTDGSLDSSFNLSSLFPTSYTNIEDMGVSSTKIYLYGKFEFNGKAYHDEVVAVNLSDLSASDWNGHFWRKDSYVFGHQYRNEKTLAISGEGIFIRGNRGVFGRENIVRSIAAFDKKTGQLLNAFPFAGGKKVNTLALSPDQQTLYIGGIFNNVGDVPRESLASINLSDFSVKSWIVLSGMTSPEVKGLYLNGNEIIIAGQSIMKMGVDELPRRNLGAVSTINGEATAWDPSPDGEIEKLHVFRDKIYVVGSFTTIAGEARNGFAAFDLDTKMLLPENWLLDGRIGDISHYGDSLYFTVREANGIKIYQYINGEFKKIFKNVGISDYLSLTVFAENSVLVHSRSQNFVTANEGCYGFGIYNAKSNVFESCPSRLVPGNTFKVLEDPVGNRRILIGNYFDEVKNSLNAVQILHLDDMSVQHIEADDRAQSGALVDNILYLSGGFSDIQGEPRDYLAAIDIDQMKVIPWNPQPDDWVEDVVYYNDSIYVSGDFSEIGGASVYGVAKLDKDSGLADSSWTTAMYDNTDNFPRIKLLGRFLVWAYYDYDERRQFIEAIDLDLQAKEFVLKDMPFWVDEIVGFKNGFLLLYNPFHTVIGYDPVEKQAYSFAEQFYQDFYPEIILGVFSLNQKDYFYGDFVGGAFRTNRSYLFEFDINKRKPMTDWYHPY